MTSVYFNEDATSLKSCKLLIHKIHAINTLYIYHEEINKERH